MNFTWQEIAEQHASRIRELENLASELQYALMLATGRSSDDDKYSSQQFNLWKTWIHEEGCQGADEDSEEECTCDGNYIIQIVEEALSQRI